MCGMVGVIMDRDGDEDNGEVDGKETGKGVVLTAMGKEKK